MVSGYSTSTRIPRVDGLSTDTPVLGRHSFAGISTTGYDGTRGNGTNDGSDTGNDGGDNAD